jgi:hypothetical protein
MRKLGARTITGASCGVKHRVQILALNTEKAHNVKKSLETIRMARALAKRGEDAAAVRFEFEPGRFSRSVPRMNSVQLGGSAYGSLLRRIEFPDDSLEAVREREARAAKYSSSMTRCRVQSRGAQRRGLTSHLKPFVIARVNPIRFSKATEFDFDEVMDKTIAAATRFKVDRVKQEDVARVGGAPPDEE